MGKAFEMMKQGLDDASGYAEGNKARGRVANPSADVPPVDVTVDDTRGLEALAVMLTAFTDGELLSGFQTLEVEDPKVEVYVREMAKRALEF